MKILYLHQYYNNPAIGGSTRSYEMAKRLVSYGHEVHMITSTRDVDVSSSLTIEEGIFVHWIKTKYSNEMRFYHRIYAFLKFAVLSFVKGLFLRADLVFATSTPLTIAIPGIALSKTKRIPLVFEVRDLWPEIPIAMGILKNSILIYFAKQLELIAYRNSSKIVALSNGMKEGIVKAGYNSNLVEVISNGSDLNIFNPQKSKKSKIRANYFFSDQDIIMLYPGTLGVVNNVGYLVKLCAAMRDNNLFKVVVLGDGAEKSEIKKLAIELNVLNHNFFMYNKVSKVEIVDFFEMSDMVISTILPIKELEANSANKYFDALASGTCMVVNHGGWQAAELEKYNCGFQLPSSINNAVNILSNFISNPQEIAQMGLNARRLAENFYDRDILAMRLNNFLLKN